MSKRGITLYLHAHQPWRVRQYTIFDTAKHHDYFEGNDGQDNEAILHKVAQKSYLPMNKLLLKLLQQHPEFKLSLSITGTLIEQLERYSPETLETFKDIVATGRVEIVAETYYHSLAFFYDIDEFAAQVNAHKEKIQQTFGVTPQSIRNTELAYNDALAQWADKNGYKAILAEGWDPVLEWRSPNYIYQPPGTENIKLLLKNYKLSDDLAFRFSNRNWEGWPLTADTYHSWAEASIGDAPLTNLFMDYETFGEHQWADSGIFEFFEHFVAMWHNTEDNVFYTVSEAADAAEPAGELSMPHTVTWADTERDLTAWLGNSMQHEAMYHLYALKDAVMRSNDIDLIGDWRKLQTSDHPYYMCTKWFSDGDVHAYFSPYKSPYDAFLAYMNVIRDMRYRLHAHHGAGRLHG